MGAFLLEFALGGWNWIKSAFAALRKFLGSLNAQGVCGLIVSLILACLAFTQWGDARHWHKQSDRYEALYQADQAQDAKLAAQALKIKNDLDQIDQNISSIWKGWNDAQNSRIAGSAVAIKLLGPGKAACAGDPGHPSGSSGPQPSSGTGNATVDSVPSGQGFDLIGLPFSDTIDFAANHDTYRAESLTWRSWYAQLAKSWPKSTVQSPPPSNGTNP